MAKVKDRKLISTYGHRILDGGFYALPNMILDYQQELGLSDVELMFYIKVTHFYTKKQIDVRQLNMSASQSMLYKIRAGLIEKGYLRLVRDERNKLTLYDWSGLIEAMEKLKVIPCGGMVIPPHGMGLIIETKEDVKELIQQQQQNDDSKKDVVVVILRLVKMGMSEDAAKYLIEHYPLQRIMEKLEYCEKSWKIWEVNNPGGWLRKAIEQDWNVKNREKEKDIDVEKAKLKYEEAKKHVENEFWQKYEKIMPERVAKVKEKLKKV